MIPLLHHHCGATIGQKYTLSNAAGHIKRKGKIIIHENDNDVMMPLLKKDDFTPKKKEPSADLKTTKEGYTLAQESTIHVTN